jgi:hypothetical protein
MVLDPEILQTLSSTSSEVEVPRDLVLRSQERRLGVQEHCRNHEARDAVLRLVPFDWNPAAALLTGCTLHAERPDNPHLVQGRVEFDRGLRCDGIDGRIVRARIVCEQPFVW